MTRRVCAFAVAHTDLSAQPFNNAGRTLRLLAPCNLAGSAVFIKFSNYYGEKPVWVGNATLALADPLGNLIPGSLHPLTVQGDTSFALVPQRDIFSDRIPLEVQPGQTIAVSLYYPASDRVVSGNFVSTFSTRSIKGDWCAEADLPQAKVFSGLSRTMLPWDITSATTTLSGILVEQESSTPSPSVIAAFGDSIMQQGAWVTPFTRRLYEAYPGQVSVCNLGIGGNRLLFDSPGLLKGLYGHRGVDRLRYDLLPLEGLTHVIFCLGTNDIGLPGKDGTPDSELIALADYQQGVQRVVQALRCRDLKIYAGLLLPRETKHPFTPEREALRLSVNNWLRCCGLFDGVLDLGAPVTSPQGGIKKDCFLPDGLHPNKAGGLAIAQSLDLGLFAPTQGGTCL